MSAAPRLAWTPDELAGWSEADLLELWHERAAMRCAHTPHTSFSDIRQAEYLAAKDVRLWCGGRHLPDEILQGLRKLR